MASLFGDFCNNIRQKRTSKHDLLSRVLAPVTVLFSLVATGGVKAMRVGSVVVVLALLGGSTALADDAGLQLPPNWFAGLPSPKTRTVKDPIFDSMIFGKLKVVFEKSRLADVAAEVKGSRIKHRGDAGESMYWLCYRFKDKDMTGQLYVTAHGEMGGPEHAVGGVVLKDKISDETDCPELPSKLLPVNSDNGLGLGSRYEDFLLHLGKPGTRLGDRALWMVERETHLGGSPEPWTVLQSVEVEFHDGKAATLSLNQVTSN